MSEKSEVDARDAITAHLAREEAARRASGGASSVDAMMARVSAEVTKAARDRIDNSKP